jgi:hypothetical protein
LSLLRCPNASKKKIKKKSQPWYRKMKLKRKGEKDETGKQAGIKRRLDM